MVCLVICERWYEALDHGPVDGKMTRPPFASRMEDRDDGLRIWINRREVRSLARIAVIAGEREVFRRIAAAVLARDDGLEVKAEERLGVLSRNDADETTETQRARRRERFRIWFTEWCAFGELDWPLCPLCLCG